MSYFCCKANICSVLVFLLITIVNSVLFNLVFTQPYEGSTVISSILQMRKLKLREIILSKVTQPESARAGFKAQAVQPCPCPFHLGVEVNFTGP